MAERALAPLLFFTGATAAAEDRALLGVSDLHQGLLVVPISPLVDSLTRVAGSALQRLGKSLDRAPMGRREADESGHLQDWLHAHQLSVVAFHTADRLPTEVLLATDRIVRAAGARAAFTFRTRPAAANAVRRLRQSAVRGTVGTAVSALADLRRAPSPAPNVPSAAIVFEDPYAAPPNAEWATAVRLVRAVFVGSTTPGERLQAFDDARARLAKDGWDLRIARPGQLVDPIPERVTWLPVGFAWSDLHALRGTNQVAIAVLATVGVSALEMIHLRPEHVALDGSAVAVTDDVLPVPHAARIFLRARHATLAREGRLRHPFLSRDQRPAAKGDMRTAVAAVFGSPVRRRDLPLRVEPLSRWLGRHGLTLESKVPRGAAATRYLRPGRTEPSYTYRGRHDPWPARRGTN